MNIGSRVKDARKAANLSQEELARRAGVPLNRVGRIETGVVTDPHYSTLESIARGLDMQVGELLEEPALPGKGEASRVAGPLSPEWAHRADPDVFRLRIREAESDEIRELGAALVAEFYRVRTREELVEEGPKPESRKVRAFSLAGILSEELARRGEKPLERYILALKRFAKAVSGEEEETFDKLDANSLAGLAGTLDTEVERIKASEAEEIKQDALAEAREQRDKVIAALNSAIYRQGAPTESEVSAQLRRRKKQRSRQDDEEVASSEAG